MNKKCIVCNNNFITNMSYKKCCSINCMHVRAKLNRKKYYEDNKLKISGKCKVYRLKNIIKIKEGAKKYYLKNKNEIIKKISEKRTKEDCKRYYQKHKTNILKYHKQYRIINLEKIKEKRKQDLKNNEQLKLRETIRLAILQRIRKANTNKLGKTEILLGCTIKQFKDYIEKQFKFGMTWENHGYYTWHLDYRVPISKFDLTKLEEQKKCFHYTNIQPLWMHENLSKGNKIQEVVINEI